MSNSVELAYQKYCEERFSLPTEADVLALEKRLKITLPEHYRNYLLNWNGGYFLEPCITPPEEGGVLDCPTSSFQTMFGIGAPLIDDGDVYAELGQLSDILTWDNNDPVIMLPIGDTVMGAYIVMNTLIDDEGFGCVALRTFDSLFWLADSMEDFFALFGDKRETQW